VTAKPGKSPRLVALDALARREHSRHELRDRLRERHGVDGEALDAVLDALEADGLLSDRRFAESFARARAGRGQGPVRIRHDLRGRGVAAALVDEALAALDVDWYRLAADLLARRFGEAPPEDYAEKARRMRFLQQRGFSHDQIREAVDGIE
jgi:regulatory protein